jgi:hypothetical protein
MVRILPSFVVHFATHRPSSHAACPTQNLLHASTLRMSKSFDADKFSRMDAITVGSIFYVMILPNLSPSYKSSFEVAPLEGDNRETTALLKSAC